MSSAKMLLSIFFGFLILAGAVSALAEDAKVTVNGVEFTLVPEKWVVNYARYSYKIPDNACLMVPIYGMEDQILSYFVIFSKKEYTASTIEELFSQQYTMIEDVLKAYDQLLKGEISDKEYEKIANSHFDSFLMDDYYKAGKFHCLLELGPDYVPGMGGTPIWYYWCSKLYLQDKFGVEPEFVCIRETEELGVCLEFKVANESILIKNDIFSSDAKMKMKDECSSCTMYSKKLSEKNKSEIESNIKKWEEYKDSYGYNDFDNNPSQVILPDFSNYNNNCGSCAWTACSNFLSWTNYQGWTLAKEYDEDWIIYEALDDSIFNDSWWGNQVQDLLVEESGSTHPQSFIEVRDALSALLEDCGYMDGIYDTWLFDPYCDYPCGGDHDADSEYQWDNIVIWELTGYNDENASLALWAGFPEGYTYEFYQDHAVAIIGAKDDGQKRYLLVSWGDGLAGTYHEVVWWGDNTDYIPTEDENFDMIVHHPRYDDGVFCTLAYFLGVAGANNVELALKIDGEPDLGFQGFYLYRANNKSDLGKISAIAEFYLQSPAHPDGYTVQQFMTGIRYTDTPPTNEKFYYMLSEIAGDSWIFEINTDGSADEDDYLTYCSDSDVEGGLNQPLPPDCPGTLPPFICSGQPGGPPRPDPPSNADAIDNPNDYGGAIKLTWTPAQGPYITNQKIFRSYANSPCYGSFQLIATLDKYANSYVDNTVENNNHYYYVIRSVVISGGLEYQSYDSRMTTAVAQDNRPYPPYNLAAQDKPGDQGGATIISFNPPYAGEAGIDYYRIFRKIPGSGMVAMIGTVDATGQPNYSFTDVNAPIGIDYEYWAKSVGFNQLLSYESNHGVCHSVDNIAPTPPSNLTAITSGLTVVLNWTLSRNDPFYTGPQGLTPRDVQEYHIYRWTNTGLQKNDLKSNDYPLAIVPAGTSGYTDSTVQPGTTYYYCVKSKDSSNLSVSSNVVTIHTPANISLKDDLQFSDNDVSPSSSEKSGFSFSPLSDLLKMNNSKSDVSGLDALSNDDSFGIFASEISIYPNPASESVNIKIPESVSLASVPCTVHIYDLTGRLVYEAVGDYADTVCWNLCDNNGSMLASGIYIINIENQYDQSTKPLLIMR